MSSSEESQALTAELLRSALRQVESTYREHALGLFRGKLRMAVLEWSESEKELGAWVRETRTLRLSVVLLERPWGELVEVLKHEMAHQFVDEVLGVRDEGPHGPVFKQVCEERGIDGRAGGAMNSSDEGGGSTPLLRRVAALLALARSDNRNEAEAATAAARRLMLKYNLELAETPTALPAYSFRHLGEPTGRRAAWQRALATILGDFFFVDVLIVPVYRPREGKRGSVLEIMGRVENLEIAAYVHDFLERSADTLWREHKRAEGLSRDQDRQSFLYGVMSGFRHKLTSESRKSQQEGLVWAGDADLRRYARARHPYVRSVGSSGRVSKDAFTAGHRAGQGIVISRGVTAGSSGRAPRLLGGKT